MTGRRERHEHSSYRDLRERRMSEPGAESAYRATAARDAHDRATPDPAIAARLDRARRGIAGDRKSSGHWIDDEDGPRT